MHISLVTDTWNRNPYTKVVVPGFLQYCHKFSVAMPIFRFYYDCSSMETFQ